MNLLLIYTVKVAVYLLVFYLIYFLLLINDTSFSRNRAYIIVSLLFAFLLPFIRFQTAKPMDVQLFGKILSDVFVTATPLADNNHLAIHDRINIVKTIFYIYITGITLFTIKFLFDLSNLMILILRNKDKGNRIIRFKGLQSSCFSAMGYIFLNSDLKYEEETEIIKHEQNHLNRNHFIDIILVQIAKAFQWFNPVIYFYNSSLRALHEYQADKECLNSGITIVNYQRLLLSHVFKSGEINLSNCFSNPSLIRKRITMMTKAPTSALSNIKLLTAIPVTGFVFITISTYEVPTFPKQEESLIIDSPTLPIQTINKPIAVIHSISETDKVSLPEKSITTTVSKKSSSVLNSVQPIKSVKISLKDINTITKVNEENTSSESEENPFVVVEEMPMFPGGELELLKYIGENTKYPEIAKMNGIQGRVIARFCVSSTGKITQISVLKGVTPELDAEAVRVISTLPTFEPGKQGGKAVPVWYMVPITFSL
jgi:TonB family protein